MVETRPLSRVDPGAGEREALHLHARAGCERRERFEVLQPVELARPELARRERRAHHHFHDVRRQALDPFDGRDQLVGEPREELLRARTGLRLGPLSSTRDTTG